MRFTAALTYKSVCKTYLITSYSHDKGKYSVAVFVDFHYNHFDIPGAVHIHCKVPSITQSEAQKTFLIEMLCYKPWEKSC